ncbi:MAG: STAS domain-containing protein [Candidatus Omnitrophica bacterium]|nr:STAS domain-containing protein [Candidatus Omnitrophota bacterium]
MLKPKILTTLKDYSWSAFRSDLIAGVIVGVVALPLAIAFAIASGVSPDRGLITAVVAGFLISALGGSRVQIGGPTGAFVVIVYGIVQKYGLDGLMMATLLGGFFLLLMGLARFGAVIKFIPYPVTIGFTSGIALIIFSSQIKDFFGLKMGALPPDFLEKWILYFKHWNTFNPYTVILSAATVAIILLWQKVTRKIPGSVIALVLTTAAAHWLRLPVETISSRFGDIAHTLPIPHLPVFRWELMGELIRPALAIAILAGIESLLSAVVADGMIGGKHRSNMELVAQGIANMVSPLFGGIPATGAIARTATNVHNGARTPVAGMVHALTLFLIMILFSKWAGFIPLATLAGILMIVAYRMSEWHSFQMILKAPRSDAVVLLVTFALTVLIDLTVAIEVGMVLAAFLLIYRLSLASNINTITREFTDEEERDDPNAVSKRQIPKGVEIFEINGPFFFGMVSTFIETMNNIENKPKVRILRMRHVLTIDATALNALRQVSNQSRKNGITLILSGIHAQPLAALQKSGLFELIGEENISANIDLALERACAYLGPES